MSGKLKYGELTLQKKYRTIKIFRCSSKCVHWKFKRKKARRVNKKKGFDPFWFKCREWNFYFNSKFEKKNVFSLWYLNVKYWRRKTHTLTRWSYCSREAKIIAPPLSIQIPPFTDTTHGPNNGSIMGSHGHVDIYDAQQYSRSRG